MELPNRVLMKTKKIAINGAKNRTRSETGRSNLTERASSESGATPRTATAAPNTSIQSQADGPPNGISITFVSTLWAPLPSAILTTGALEALEALEALGALEAATFKKESGETLSGGLEIGGKTETDWLDATITQRKMQAAMAQDRACRRLGPYWGGDHIN